HPSRIGAGGGHDNVGSNLNLKNRIRWRGSANRCTDVDFSSEPMDAAKVIQLGWEAGGGSNESHVPAGDILRGCARKRSADAGNRVGSDNDGMEVCRGVYDKYVRYACDQADGGIAACAVNGEEIGHIDAVWGGDGVGLRLGPANLS